MKCSDNLKNDIATILDVFGGADGGIGFAKFNFSIKDIAEKLDNGTLPSNEKFAAIEILNIINKFRRLLDSVTK